MAEVEKKTKQKSYSGAPVRLYVKGVFTGFKRNRINQRMSKALIKIQGVEDRQSTYWYKGKKIAYIYKAHNKVRNTKYRVIWGTVRRAHGNNGMVIAVFKHNLPARAMGAQVRIMLYPHRFQHSVTDYQNGRA